MTIKSTNRVVSRSSIIARKTDQATVAPHYGEDLGEFRAGDGDLVERLEWLALLFLQYHGLAVL